jgi:hypothetical protein
MNAIASCYTKSKQPEPLSQLSCKFGAPMGRRNTMDADREHFHGTMHLTVVPMIDGDYDRGGAYWGAATPKTGWLYRAWYYGEDEDGDVVHIEMFVRGVTRRAAKLKVLEEFPKARFYK